MRIGPIGTLKKVVEKVSDHSLVFSNRRRGIEDLVEDKR